MVIIFILLLLCSLIFSKHISKSSRPVEVVYMISQILTSVFVVSGTVVAVWQYYLSSKSEIVNVQMEKVQRAIELSEYYKDNILKKYAAMKYVFEKAGIAEILRKIKVDDMKHFDGDELNSLLSPTDINKIKSIQKSQEYVDAILEANSVYNLKLDENVSYRKIEKDGEKGISIDYTSVVVGFISEISTDTLNNLEFFAMHFYHKTADDTVVYRSLHQTYLQIVQGMYYSIAKTNQKPQSKYFTNVIWLYREWYNKNQEEIQSLKESSKLSHGTVVAELEK